MRGDSLQYIPLLRALNEDRILGAITNERFAAGVNSMPIGSDKRVVLADFNRLKAFISHLKRIDHLDVV